MRTSAEHRDQPMGAGTVASVDPHSNKKFQDEPLSIEPIHLENDEPEVIVAEERSLSPLYEIMPLLPIEGTLEWIERQRVREEYNAIERARAYRLELESQTADVHEASFKVAGVWDKELRDWGEKCQRAKMAKNLALFDASMGRNGATATFGEVDPQSPVEESNDIEVELDLRDYTISVAEKMMYKDTNMYMLPRPWNMGDRPRRTRLYENIEYLEQYLKQEMIIIPLIEERLNYLHEGRSEQPEHAVVVEIRGLEKQLAVHSNGQSNNERLMHDHLRHAADWMLVDMETGSQETCAFDGRALTDSFSPFLVKFIRSFPRLKRRFRLIRDVEKFYFPDRFKASSQPQLRAQPTPGGRRIPMRRPRVLDPSAQITAPQHDQSSSIKDLGYPLERVDSQQTMPRVAQTLPRSFKLKAPKLLALLRSKGEPYFSVPTLEPKMLREPTSPLNPPSTEYLGPPKPKRKPPLRMASLPSSPGLYTPPKILSPLSKPEIFRYIGSNGELNTFTCRPPDLKMLRVSNRPRSQEARSATAVALIGADKASQGAQ